MKCWYQWNSNICLIVFTLPQEFCTRFVTPLDVQWMFVCVCVCAILIWQIGGLGSWMLKFVGVKWDNPVDKGRVFWKNENIILQYVPSSSSFASQPTCKNWWMKIGLIWRSVRKLITGTRQQQFWFVCSKERLTCVDGICVLSCSECSLHKYLPDIRKTRNIKYR